jgi:hypothetical protein
MWWQLRFWGFVKRMTMPVLIELRDQRCVEIRKNRVWL